MYSLKEGSKFEDFALMEALSDITEAVSKSTGTSHVQQLRNYSFNHKNYNFLACDWFKNVLFSTRLDYQPLFGKGARAPP